MRSGDCGVEVIAADGGVVRELASGHVLARPGQRYSLRLRNFGPLRGVADVRIDGRPVTAGGLVLEPLTIVDLERPIHATERGRFTVVAEGSEEVFGPDGGRDNPELGVIEVHFRRELPRAERVRPIFDAPYIPGPSFQPPSPDRPTRQPLVPPEWTPPRPEFQPVIASHAADVSSRRQPRSSDIERAAGTGLSGQSAQEFRTVQVGELETEATVIRLRIVIGSVDAIEAARPLPVEEPAPLRPEPRP